MEIIVERVDVWAANIEDKPGGLAGVLATLRDVGADLQFIIARRAPQEPGRGVVFVAPLQGDREIAAAAGRFQRHPNPALGPRRGPGPTGRRCRIDAEAR